MQRFMPDGVHTEKATNAPSQNGDAKKCPFRDTPQIFSGAALVLQHKHKPGCID